MTTSILSPLSNELRGIDLQTLRDFALEAPYEWRKAFESLIEAAENDRDVDEVKNDLTDELVVLREACADAAKEIRTEMKTFLDKKLRTHADVAELSRVVNSALEDLETAAEPRKRAPAVALVPPLEPA